MRPFGGGVGNRARSSVQAEPGRHTVTRVRTGPIPTGARPSAGKVVLDRDMGSCSESYKPSTERDWITRVFHGCVFHRASVPLTRGVSWGVHSSV